MGKLIIDGNKVYTVDESCLKRKNLPFPQMSREETQETLRRMEEKIQAQKAVTAEGRTRCTRLLLFKNIQQTAAAFCWMFFCVPA